MLLGVLTEPPPVTASEEIEEKPGASFQVAKENLVIQGSETANSHYRNSWHQWDFGTQVLEGSPLSKTVTFARRGKVLEYLHESCTYNPQSTKSLVHFFLVLFGITPFLYHPLNNEWAEIQYLMTNQLE